MGFIGQTRYVDFRIVDLSNNPITNLVLGDFIINPTPTMTEATDEYSPTDYTIIFERNNIACTDTLTLFNHNDGRYTLLYTPTAVGHDYLDIWAGPYGIRDLDIEEIANANGGGGGGGVSSNVAILNQNYPTSNNLLITTANPQTYTLYVFLSSDWEVGNKDPMFALGFSALSTSGQWVNSITVPDPGTYHIVIINSTTTQVAFPFLSVS